MATITKYQEAYDKFVNPPKTGNEKPTACDRLKEFRMLAVFLKQEKNTYWRRPCWADWPCAFTQHRAEIDKLTERLHPLGQELERECLIETNVKLAAKATEEAMRRAFGDQSTTTETKANASAQSHPHVANRDINQIHHMTIKPAYVSKV